MKRFEKKQMLSAVLAASMAISTVTASVPVTVAAASSDSSLPTLTVDMTPDTQRELKHGASGWLYGLGDDGVPTANTMTALKPHTAVQKAPNGMQHPNGDTLDIADTFLNAGGQDIQIYVPDYYALWFYEFSSTEEYLKILRMEAEACIEKGIAEDVVYVLYNEPQSNWIGGSYTDPETGTVSTGWESLFWFWEDMYNMVVEVYEENGVAAEPRFAGLNLAGYNESVMDSYIKFCVEHSCMPDVVTWHDLSTGQYNRFHNEYNHYRSLEKKYLTEENKEKYGIDITPREIVINEYADTYECASPGDLVRWIGLFEDYNVSGCLPFWHLSDNLNGLAADNNEGNGAWWLYKWYGDMSGQYLPVTTTNTEQANYYGVASLDENKKSANVVFGGVNGSGNIVLEDIGGTETFKDADKVHIKIEATDYTGFHGAAEEPRIVKQGAVEVVDGKVTIPVSGMWEMSAYRITVTQATETEETGFLSTTWKQMYEAENGIFSGDTRLSDPASNMACSGRKKAGWIIDSDDVLELQVTVPKDGYYKYDMVYTAANGCNSGDPDKNTPYTALQNLLIDGEQVEQMVLPTTLAWGMGSMYSTYVKLSSGTHTFKITGTSDPRTADVDCIYLTYEGVDESDLAFHKTYEAELSEFNELSGNKTALKAEREGDIDYVSGLEKTSVVNGGGLRFNAIVSENGMYTLKLRYSSEIAASANIYQDNDAVNLDRLTTTIALDNTNGEWDNAYETVFLQRGINVIDIDTDAAIRLDYVNVSKADVDPVAVVEAEDGVLTGEAAVGTDGNIGKFASEGGYISGIKAANSVEVIQPDDPEFQIYGLGRTVDLGEAVDKNSLTIKVTVDQAGVYNMAVYQSNGELFGKHSYNAQMTERYASFSVNGGEAKKVVFRNTYSDETFRSQVIPVTLKAGENTIKIYNDNSKVVTNGIHKGGTKIPANIDYNVLINYTPNFDRFEFYTQTADVKIPEKEVFQIITASSEGGIVTSDKTKVEPGGTVRLKFIPDEEAELKAATVNGENILDQLTKFGGVYILRDVQSDVNVKAVFEITAEENQEQYIYSVNCGDVNPVTLSPGDVFGSSNSVTDQFYGEDPSTGKKWGVVDTYKANSKYPDFLTGEKTWPCENDGATDASSRSKSFRYARNQATTDVGVVYKFELEPEKVYGLELGFYVPSSWTNANNPRTMKLVLNGTVAEGYENFTASNDANNPYKIQTTAVADGEGNLEVQIGHADNAVWGPVISYINIVSIGDSTELKAVIERVKGYDESVYNENSWAKLQTVLERAEAVANNADASQTEIDRALKKLLKCERGLVEKEVYEELEKLIAACSDKTQGAASEEIWNEFLTALENAKYVLQSGRFSTDDIKATAQTLKNAAEKLDATEGMPFVDVPERIWFEEAVQYVYDNKIMTGMDETHFAPEAFLNRGQIVTILYRMEGKEPVEFQEVFPDVKEGEFYSNAVIWANTNDIVKGYEDGRFGPEDELTREQFATILYRYAEYKGYVVSTLLNPEDFPDGDQVSEFAKTAVAWAVQTGLIKGDNGKLNPQEKTNRAQCAEIVKRFMSIYK